MLFYNSLYDEDKSERSRIKKHFGRNIRSLRRQKGLTQEKMAEMAGINPKYLGEIERGIKNPTALIVQRIAAALGVPVCEILSKEGCPIKGARLSERNGE